MPATAARAVLRPSSRVALRHQVAAPGRRGYASSEASSSSSSSSTTAQATAKAKETASNIQSKASEGLSKVKSSAGPTLSKASEAATEAAGKAGQKTGGLIARVQSLIPPTIYYSKVFFELSKLVFKGQKMQPPSAAQMQSYYQPLIKGLRNPSTLVSQNANALSPQQAINYVRGITTKQVAGVAVILAEVLGFFTVGEMIGRMKIVGYRGDPSHEHH